MCMLSEWLPMAGNWCRGLHGGIGGTSFLSQSLPLSLCHTHTGTHLHRCTQIYTLIGKHPLQDTHANARRACTHARPAQTGICLYAHALWARMIKVLCRGDSELYCAAAACFPCWIQATSSVFSNGEETRHHKCKIRGNYVVICHMKYFFVAGMGFPLLQI